MLSLITALNNAQALNERQAQEAAAYRLKLEEVRASKAQLEQALAARDSKIAELEARVFALDAQLNELNRMVYGSSSERFEGLAPAGVIGNLFADPVSQAQETEAEEEQTEEVPGYTRRKKRKKSKEVKYGPGVTVETALSEPDFDTTGLKLIGYTVTRVPEYHPGRIVVTETKRPKYADPKDADAGIKIAPRPKLVVPGVVAGPGLLAHLAVLKLVDHTPLYRIRQAFMRSGITLPRSTQSDWMLKLGEHLRPMSALLVEEILGSGYIQADETRLPVQDRSKKGKTHSGYWWVYNAPAPKLVAVTYSESRRGDAVFEFLKTYRGALQSDGYRVYDDFEKHPHIELHGCWAHVRRKFYNLTESDPKTAVPMMEAIQGLYAIEDRLRQAESSREERQRVRQAHSVPILNEILRLLDDAKALPRSALGRAVNYTTLRWEKLTRFTEDGRIELDNNLVENAIRPLALGRKNYLFAGSHRAARAMGVLYSLFGTCKLHMVNPEKWLTDVLKRMVDQPPEKLAELLPHRWSPLEEEVPP